MNLLSIIRTLKSMFIQQDTVNCIGCAIQLDFDQSDGHMIDANMAQRIATIIQNEVNRLLPNNPQGFQPFVLQSPLPPYSMVELNTSNFVFGYIAGGMKVNQNQIWCGINHIQGGISNNVCEFINFFNMQIQPLINVRRIKRIGIIQSYTTPNSNTNLDRIIQSQRGGFTISNAVLESKETIEQNLYNTKLSIKKDTSNTLVHFDVFADDILDINIALEKAQQIADLVGIENQLNLFTIISE